MNTTEDFVGHTPLDRDRCPEIDVCMRCQQQINYIDMDWMTVVVRSTDGKKRLEWKLLCFACRQNMIGSDKEWDHTMALH